MTTHFPYWYLVYMQNDIEPRSREELLQYRNLISWRTLIDRGVILVDGGSTSSSIRYINLEIDN
jgi:hypothetical protein